MRLSVLCLVLVLALPGVAAAGDPVTRTFDVSFDELWEAMDALLGQQGWEIEHAARALGVLWTKSQRVAGDNEGLHSRHRRARLRLQLVPTAGGRTTVTIAREDFARERVLWIWRDEPVVVRDPLIGRDFSVERRVFAALGRAY
ncbi:MAG: hypothetical protein HY614_00780 [Candidatus Rokubacteria bacterium]|nr:hypothetical protein [Candidatus Rokubacteria bacterium]